MKWVGLIFAVAIIWAIATGNMGGAKKATQNFADVRSGSK